MAKRVVHYLPDEVTQIFIGMGALVKPVDHESDLVSNKKYVLTSVVIKCDDDGSFETLNSLYVPIRQVN
jgi:hypothetical protein